MNRQFSRSRFRHLKSLATVVVFSWLLLGCSFGGSRVQTWDGSPSAADQAAILMAPSTVKVLRVNGQKMTSFLMDDLALDYELLPGRTEVLFVYKTIWAKTGIVENGESKVHVVQTPPQRLVFDAQPNETYRFDIEKPESRAEAEAYVEDFSVPLTDAAGAQIASSNVWTPESSRNIARTPVPAGDSGNATLPAGQMQSVLDQMKALWGDATEEEKREFLRWAFE